MEHHKAPGKSDRNGISLVEIMDLFPDEASAAAWFESRRWPNGVQCPRCESKRVAVIKSGKPMPYRCKGCRRHFSVRTLTDMAESRLPLRKWALALYLCATHLKGISSMKLHRDLKITQKSAWFMLHRIRDGMAQEGSLFAGPVEVDETYIGGKNENRHGGGSDGPGGAGKAIVAGAKDRETGAISAEVVSRTDRQTLSRFVEGRARHDAQIYSDDHAAYKKLPYRHESVNHSVGEYVRGMAHVNGIESFWSLLKRGYHGTFHHFSKKHMQRYVEEFSARASARELDTIDQMGLMVQRMVGRRLRYRELIAG